MTVLSATDANYALPPKPATVTNESCEPLLEIEQPLFKVDSGLISGEQAGSTPPRLVEFAIRSSVWNQAGRAVPHSGHG